MTSAYNEGAKNYHASDSPSPSVTDKKEYQDQDYQKLADITTMKLINKTLANVKPAYFCPLCARNYDVQTAFLKRQELGNHILYGHSNKEMLDWLQELEDYAELKRGIKRY